MKKICCFIFLLSFYSFSHADSFKIAGPCVIESLPFILASDKKNLENTEIDFKLWNSPNQVRAMIAGKQIDGAIITTHCAFMLKKKGINLKIAAVFENSLWIVSNTKNLFAEPKDIKGLLLIPFGADEMPDLILKESFGSFYENIHKKHMGSAFEAVNFLLMGKGSHALLSEPLASFAVKRSKNAKSDYKLIKAFDLKNCWKDKYETRKLVLSCFAVFGNSVNKEEEVSIILKKYKEGIDEIFQYPDKSFKTISNKLPGRKFSKDFMDINENKISIFTGQKAESDTIFFLKKISKNTAPVDFLNLFMDVK